MTARVNQLSFPPGTELVFGPQASRRQFIAERLASVMRGWGFSEIILPAFDDGETFNGAGDADGFYHLTDREGRRLTLRADFTQIAAKALAVELRREQRPIRASYEGRVYRFAPSGHGHRVEQTQRGLEWVHAPGVVYDAALLTIARECLASAGIDDAVTVIGHAGFVAALLGEEGRREHRLYEALDHKNIPRIREIAGRINLSAERTESLAALPFLTGGRDVLERVRKLPLPPEAAAELKSVEALAELIEQAGIADGVLFDLGEVRRFDYYSGFMFKVYHPKVSEELGGGGRYDRLFDRFDMDVPAVGFGFNLAKLAEACSREGFRTDEAEQISDAKPAHALKRITELRARGRTVILGKGE